jgi:hypothetical protein
MIHSTVRARTVLVLALSLPSVAVAQSPPLQRAQAMLGAGNFAGAARILDSMVHAGPQNGRVWLALGAARRALGLGDSAVAAFQQAMAFPLARPQATRALFLANASLGRRDEAYRWFQAARHLPQVDLTSLAGDSSVRGLHDDPRFADLFPDRISFDPPFVEHARIIHEWRGERAGDEFGWIARPIGDVDRDRVSDLVVSAPSNLPYGTATGWVYVYSGKSGALLWKHEGTPGATLGISVEAAGDVNRDGVPDVIAGAPGVNMAFVYSGRDGRELLRLSGDSADQNLGSNVAGVGDLDHDGYADVIAAAPGSNATAAGAGRAYVFSGRDGRRLLTLDGEAAGNGFGSATAGGSGFIVVGSGSAGPQGLGRVYVYRGLSSQPLFMRDADSTGAAFGSGFASVLGDLNGDGTPDIYAVDFSNRALGPATGRAYVFSGVDGATLLTITGDSAGEGFGIGPAVAGDLDGDGRADLVVGSWQYGGAAWSGGRVTVRSGQDGHVLEAITGKVPGETLGFDAAGIGDVDGDGRTDYLVTSAWSMVNGLRSGRTYIVAGTIRHAVR